MFRWRKVEMKIIPMVMNDHRSYDGMAFYHRFHHRTIEHRKGNQRCRPLLLCEIIVKFSYSSQNFQSVIFYNPENNPHDIYK